MTTLIKHKRVEFSELFYDLVFVFAISKATTLIDHLHNGILTWNSFIDFFMAALILSLIFASNSIIVVSITTIFALAIASHFIYFYTTQNKKYSKSNWGLF